MHIIKLTPQMEIHSSSDEILMIENGNKRSIKMENQLMRILLLLIQHEGELVDKNTFIEEIWEGNKLVGAKALTKNIFKLREFCKKHQLDDTIRVETIPKRGYRLIVNREQVQRKKGRSLKYVYLAATILLLALLGLHFFPKEKSAPKVDLISYDETNTDSIIFLGGNDKVQVIDLDTVSEGFIKLDKLE